MENNLVLSLLLKYKFIDLKEYKKYKKEEIPLDLGKILIRQLELYSPGQRVLEFALDDVIKVIKKELGEE